MSISKSCTGSGWMRGLFMALTLPKTVVAVDYPLSCIEKDVVILGGGAGGTHAAVRLREDYNKTVLVVEMEDILGGHVNTYNNPATGEAFNYGVQAYIDYLGAKAFFERFDIALQPSVAFTSDATIYVDPVTGAIVPNVTSTGSLTDAVTAIYKYLDIISVWDEQQLPGYWNFFPGDEIPADLLLPFNEFVAKYNLSAMGSVLGFVSGQDIASTNPTLFTVKNFGTPVVECFLNNSCFDPLPFNNSLLYGRAATLLGSDVLYQSTITEANRTDNGVSVLVEDLQTGAQTLVSAKTILIASQASIANLAGFDLDEQETDVFSAWAYGTQYTATLQTNLIPDNTSVSFVTPANSTDTQPYSFSITWNGQSGLFWLIFGTSDNSMDEDEAKAAIVAEMLSMYNAGSLSPPGNSTPIAEVVAISNHSSVVWGETVEQLQAGFIQDLYALQGHRSTWYTGGLWCPDYSSNVWAFTDTVLPKLLAGISSNSSVAISKRTTSRLLEGKISI